MTVTNQTRKQRDVGDGVVVLFNFSFPILNTSQLEVFKIDTSVSPEVLGTALVLGVDYTATINPSTEGGTVTYTVAPGLSKTEDSFITRVTAKTQEQAIPTESNFPETQVENGLDKSRMIDVEGEEELGRAIKLPINTTLSNIELPDAESDKVIGWNTAATDLENKLNPAAAATAAALSATAAATSATNAATSATNAATSATNAATSATNAAASATAAAASAASIDKTKIVDADGDTGWESERTADVDILHAKTAGVDRVIIDSNGIAPQMSAPATPQANTLVKDNIIGGWINFDGTGTISIRDSFNVSSIVDDGVGIYTINWNTDFANVNYAVTGILSGSNLGVTGNGISSHLVGSIGIGSITDAGSRADAPGFFVMAIGDQ